MYNHIKEVYTLIDCLGDLGGLLEILFFGTLWLIYPIVYHSYLLKMIKYLYVAKSNNKEIFKKPGKRLKGDTQHKQLQFSEVVGYNLRKDLLNKRTIRVRLKDSFCLFICYYIPCLKHCWNQGKDLLSLYT